MQRDVVVIGTGPGGSSCAALLQSRGYNVTVLEQNDFIGGKCSTFEENGFKVDSGVHMFARGPNGPHGQVARELGISQPWLISDPSETMWMNENGFFYLHQKTGSLASMLEMGKAMATGKQRIDVVNTLRRSVKNFGLPGLLEELSGIRRADPAFIQKYDDTVLRDFLYQFTDDAGVHRAMNCLSMLLLVVPYTRSSAGEFIHAVSGIFKHGTLGVPRGGAVGVPRSFIRAFLRDGGALKLGVAAKGIEVKGGRVEGVVGSDGEFYHAGVVVSNAGLLPTVKLAGEKNFPGEYVKKVESLELSYSWVATKFALSRRVVDLKAPSFFPIPQTDAETMFDYCDEPDGIPEDPFLFVPFPSEWDSTVAPPGHQLIIMGVPTSNEVDQEDRSNNILQVGEQKLLSFFPDIEKSLISKSRITNKDTNRITRRGTGECIGIAQIPGQVGRDKPHPKTPVEGLYVVGCDAGARGVGTEQATASGMFASSLIS